MERTHSFGYWLRRRRKALDLTQAELAQRASCSLELIRKIEADARRPSRQLAELLADALGIDASERGAFIQAARAERPVDELALPSQPVEQPVAALPAGTITFLFTDIEGSTRLWEKHPQAMPAALARHDALLKQIVTAHRGVVFKTVGDSVLAAFAQAPDALAAALAAQRAIGTEAWELPEPPRVRMALHAGGAETRNGDYFGPALNRAARLLAAGHGGQILLSLATEQLVREQLPPDTSPRDLGSHRLKDLSLPEQIFQLVAPGLPTSFPALNTLDARHTNLPAQPTALLGRDQEVATVTNLLRRAEVRLVTLTGPGGVGKTRLSLQIAAELLDDFAHGVYFVDLAPIREPALVTSAIAAALGIHEIASQPLLATLKDYLRDKRLLLLLDNFEQVIDAAPVVAELLGAAPRLAVLVTSREVLHLRGEKEVAVVPLAIPDPASLPPLDQLSQYAAVALFIERATDARPNFVVTNANAPAVAEICARLEGLPLAIELATARIKLFAPEALLARLSSRLALLTAGPRDLPARQQTIRNTIAWSYDLLETAEQTLFCQLGVFVGGCTLEAAEAVTTSNVQTFERSNVLDTLAALVDKSLLRQVNGPDGDTRFVMLETIREFALERLELSGEAAAIRNRHAAYCLGLAEAAETSYSGTAEQAARLARLEAEHDNLRAALAWSLGGGSEEVGARLALALAEFWHIRQHLAEGRAWLASALASSAISAEVRASALNHAGILALEQGEYTMARQLLEQSLVLFRELKPSQEITVVLYHLGQLAGNQGDIERAKQFFDETLAASRETGHQAGEAWALFAKAGLAIEQQDLTTGRALYTEALALFQSLGNRWASAFVISSLGHLARAEGDDTRAAGYYEECLALAQEFGDQGIVASMRHNQAYLALHQNDPARAKALLIESLVISREIELKHQLAWDLAGMGGVAAAQGQPERAARLLGAAEAWFEATSQTIGPTEQAEHDSYAAVARAQLGEEAFAAAWAEGRAMSPEQAVAEALSERS